jgi:multidrug efflux pump subunit AcrA (membrane-fusion protein)
LLIGLAAAVALGGSYVAIAGNPLSRNQQAVTFDTAQVSQGSLQVTVSATGPVTNPSSSSSSSSSTTSSTSSAFIALSDLTSPQIAASVSEADIGRVHVGQKATFTLTAHPNRTFTGHVATIQPAGTTTSNVVTFTVLIGVDPTDVQLLPSMTATVTIVTEQDDNVVLVPNSAIAFSQSQGRGQAGAGVLVVRNGSPVRVPIQTGSSDGSNTVVVSGLTPGERVVTGTGTSGGARSGSGSGAGNIFGFGPPGGGGNRQGGQGQGAAGGQGAGGPGGGPGGGGPPAVGGPERGSAGGQG